MSATSIAPPEPAELGLTERDRRLLAMLAQGYPDPVAARRLAMSERTLRRRLETVRVVLGVSTRFQMGVQAVRMGLVPRR